ncbi:MAG: hypothetical protein R3E97_13025 [Candidatus Eisenbacteria bacterium]
MVHRTASSGSRTFHTHARSFDQSGQRAARSPRTCAVRWVLPLSSLLWIGCGDDDPAAPDPPGPPDLVAEELAVLEVADLHVEVDRRGLLTEGRRIDRECYSIFLASLWIGANVGGFPHANLSWTGSDRWSNYSSMVGESPIGPYVVTPDHLANDEIEWPIAAGYPTNGNGEPVLYGDRMVWSALRTATDGQLSGAVGLPLEGIEIGMSLFGFADEELDNVLFLRYDIHNASTETWEDVYVALYSDSDLTFGQGGVGGNRTMYLRDEGITVTYAGEWGMDQPQWMSAFAFVSTPTEGVPAHGVTSHRLMWKNAHDLYGETNVSGPTQVYWTLRGLTNLGEPMIDPSTQTETLFAVDGDPATGTGWIDDPPRDVRGIISSGPFTIEPGGSETVVGVWLVAEGDGFADARAAVVRDVTRARSDAARLLVGRTE